MDAAGDPSRPFYNSSVYLFFRVLGMLYVSSLVYFCWQHFVVWKRERSRVKRAVSIFRVLALFTLGTTAYLFYYMRSGRQLPDVNLRAAAGARMPRLNVGGAAEAAVAGGSSFMWRATKFITMCGLMLLGVFRLLARA